jgi:hypothetical protein
MSQLQVTPRVLADAAGTLPAEQASVARTGVAISAATHGIAAALPGSRTATEVESTGAELTAAVRAAAAELALLAVALHVAAAEYVAVEQDTAARLERAGRHPS